MSMVAYIVTGQTGSYDDCFDWPVCVYTDETRAKAHVASANKWAKTNGFDQRFTGVYNANNPHDPSEALVDSLTGVEYRLETVPLY